MLETVKCNLSQIKEHCVKKNIKLIYLQVPYYSIQHWNQLKGHDNPSSFVTDDKKLSAAIDELNEFIQSFKFGAR